MFTERLENFNKTVLYLLIFTAFFGPAFLVFEFGPIHLFPFRIIWIILLPLTIIFLYYKAGVFESFSKTRFYFIFLLVWLAYGVLSLAWAVDTFAAYRQIVFLLIGISVIFLITLYCFNIKDYNLLHIIWITAALIIFGIGLWNMITGEQLSLSKCFGPSRFNRPTSVFVNPNDFATYLTISIPFFITYIRYNSKLLVRIGSSIMLLVAIVLCLSTGSRFNFIALVVGGAFWFTFMADRNIKLKSIFVVMALVLLILTSFALVPEAVIDLYESSMGDGINRIVDRIRYVLEGGELGEIHPSRISYFRNGFAYLLDSNGFGIGAGNAGHYLEHYPYCERRAHFNLHNWWLDILVNYGIFIFIGFFGYYLSLIINLYRLRNRFINKNAKMISEALLVSLVTFFFASMSPSNMFGFLTLWVLFGIATGFVNMGLNNNLKET